jgi:hypothetical protein
MSSSVTFGSNFRVLLWTDNVVEDAWFVWWSTSWNCEPNWILISLVWQWVNELKWIPKWMSTFGSCSTLALMTCEVWFVEFILNITFVVMLRWSLVIHPQVVLGAIKYRNYNVCVDLTIKKYQEPMSTMLLVTLGRCNKTLVELDNDDMSVFRSQMSDKTLYHFEGCYEAKLARIS